MGFVSRSPRPVALHNSLVKRGVLVKLRVGCFSGMITARVCTKCAYHYRVHREADQNVRSMKLPLASHSTEATAAVGAWDLLGLNDAEQTGGTVGGSGRTECTGGFRSRRER